MGSGATSPEELETLLEDAAVLCDGRAAARLFEPDGVLRAGIAEEARGRAAIAQLADALWATGPGYLADPRCVARCRDLALVLGPAAANVLRRRRDGSWRYAISVYAR